MTSESSPHFPNIHSISTRRHWVLNVRFNVHQMRRIFSRIGLRTHNPGRPLPPIPPPYHRDFFNKMGNMRFVWLGIILLGLFYLRNGGAKRYACGRYISSNHSR
ncbi:hypothetical protein AVEN_232333-1 [Araneus ventricosus]|uniref:Uncharacterized protein n=1 Tax=Araneus ventricosus TaxID=182803 RepID=A0A4Y2IAH6_ARAVE|nr:hypothetical protein AVEN_232333-1 [Araneus ventricosus]